MKNKNTLKSKTEISNGYDLFVDAILSLKGDVRADVLRIGSKNCSNPYLYLFNRIQKKDVNDNVYALLMEEGLLTNEMFAHQA
jgi:hypothetical protein